MNYCARCKVLPKFDDKGYWSTTCKYCRKNPEIGIDEYDDNYAPVVEYTEKNGLEALIDFQQKIAKDLEKSYREDYNVLEEMIIVYNKKYGNKIEQNTNS